MAATVNQMLRSHQTASYFVYWVRLVWKRRLFCMRIVVLKSPKMLCGFLRKILRMG